MKNTATFLAAFLLAFAKAQEGSVVASVAVTGGADQTVNAAAAGNDASTVAVTATNAGASAAVGGSGEQTAVASAGGPAETAGAPDASDASDTSAEPSATYASDTSAEPSATYASGAPTEYSASWTPTESYSAYSWSSSTPMITLLTTNPGTTPTAAPLVPNTGGSSPGYANTTGYTSSVPQVNGAVDIGSSFGMAALVIAGVLLL